MPSVNSCLFRMQRKRKEKAVWTLNYLTGFHVYGFIWTDGQASKPNHGVIHSFMKKKRRKRKGQYKKLTWSGIYLRTVAKPLATEALREGETGEFPKNTSKRTIVTFIDLIVASTEEGRPSDEMQTWKSQYSHHISFVHKPKKWE